MVVLLFVTRRKVMVDSVASKSAAEHFLCLPLACPALDSSFSAFKQAAQGLLSC